MVWRLSWVGCAAALLTAVGSSCSSDSSSSPSPSNDASADGSPDATGGDAQSDGDASSSPDADGTTKLATGSACTANSECEGGLCLTELVVVGQSWELPGGYCSSPCTLDTDCAAGESCYQQVDDQAVDVGGACMKSCTAPGECRTDYTCLNEQCLPSTPVGANNGAWGRTWSSVTSAHAAAVDAAGNLYTIVTTLPAANLGGGPVGNSGYHHVSFTGGGVYRWHKKVAGPAPAMAGGATGYFIAGGSTQFELAAFDAVGSELWAHAFPAGGGAKDVAVHFSGPIAIAGEANGTLVVGAQQYAGSGNDDGAAVLLDPAGTPLWGTIFGTLDVRPARVAFAPNGDVWVAGKAQAFTFAGKSLAAAGGYDVFVTRHAAADGGPVDGISFGGLGTDEAFGLAVDAAGNLFVAGTFDQDMQVGTELLASTPTQRNFVASFANDGSFRWAKAFGGYAPFAARVAPSGELRVAGDFAGSMTVEGTSKNSVGSTDVYLVALSGAGAITRFETWGAPPVGQATGDDSLLGFAIDQNGANFFTGTHDGPIDFGSGELLVGGAFVARVP